MINNKFMDLAWLLWNERRSREQLRDLQTRKLRSLIRHAYENVPMYRDLFLKAGIEPGDIQTTEDLYKIPVIDKAEYHRRDESEWLDQRIADTGRLIPVRTSGSSGVSLRFYIDRRYNEFRKAQFLRPYWTNGLRPWNKTMRVSITEKSRPRWFHFMGLMREHRFYPDSDPDDQIEWLNNHKPSILQGYGSYLNLLAARVLERGMQVHHPETIFTDSELLLPGRRRTIQRAFGQDVLDVYGTFETENVAYECEAHEGYHIASDCVVMEFIKDGKPVGPNEEGHIVCTVLDNRAMPFIRYNLGDIGAFSPHYCSCGRTFPLLTRVVGRSDDYAIDSNGKQKAAIAFLGRMDYWADYLNEYQVIQESRDLVRVLVIPNRKFDIRTEQAIKECLTQDFPDAMVNIEKVGKIERGARSKLSAFISKIRN